MDTRATAKILVIDYDSDTREQIVHRLKVSDLDLTIRTAHSPVTGLQQAGVFIPDLIILDLQLPGGIGANYVDELKANPRLKTTKILMLTAQDSHANNWMQFEAGVDGFISKPLDLVELTAQVGVMLQSKSTKGPKAGSV